jgi:uncharacterized 2Fe-2S/4Fe-4S cluster protein (DUF4445 family)
MTDNGYRLACQARISGDVVVFVPEESRLGKQVVRKDARKLNIAVSPSVKRYRVKLSEATLEDPVGDWERFTSGNDQAVWINRFTH